MRKVAADALRGQLIPYCLVSTGSEVFTTRPVKKGKNLIWNEVFELLVTKSHGKKLEISVMARDEGGDLFVGSKYNGKKRFV